MTALWTKDELAEFDRLTEQMSSRDQLERISGRLALRRFVALHGEEKCNAMFAKLTSVEKPARKRKPATRSLVPE